MRRLLLTFAALATLAVPVGALAARSTAGDGTLAVRNASGDLLRQPVVKLALDGAFVGNVDRGSLVILVASGSQPTVVDSTGTVVVPTTLDSGAFVYQGNGLRFRAIGGVYRLSIYGRGIDLNAVGQGKAQLDGSSQTPSSDGKYSVNGSAWASLPAQATTFTIAA